MKATSFMIVVATLLIACTPAATSLPSPMPDTPIPTLAATAAPTAEPTRIPNWPDGATGEKGADGLYHKIEDGVTVTWNPEVQSWQRNLNVGGAGVPMIPYTTQQREQYGYTSQFLVFVNVNTNVPGFDRAGTISLHPGAGDVKSLSSFTNVYPYELGQKFKSQLTDFHKLNDGTISYTFTTSEGPQIITFVRDTTFEVDILDKPIGNGFHPFKEPYGGLNLQLRVFVENNIMEVWVVLPDGVSMTDLTKEQQMEIYLYGPALIMADPDQTVPRFFEKLSYYVALNTNPNSPFIDIGPQLSQP